MGEPSKLLTLRHSIVGYSHVKILTAESSQSRVLKYFFIFFH